MIIKDNVIGALEIGAGHRIAAVPSRLEHRCLELGEKGNKRFVVAEADTNRENFGKKAIVSLNILDRRLCKGIPIT